MLIGTLHRFIVRIVFRNALDTSAGSEVEELEGGVEVSDARALNSVGVIFILLLAWEYVKRERGTHTRKSVDICGEPWENRKTASL